MAYQLIASRSAWDGSIWLRVRWGTSGASKDVATIPGRREDPAPPMRLALKVAAQGVRSWRPIDMKRREIEDAPELHRVALHCALDALSNMDGVDRVPIDRLSARMDYVYRGAIAALLYAAKAAIDNQEPSDEP